MDSQCKLCLNKVEHIRVCLCSTCYKKKRKDDWLKNEAIRLKQDPQRTTDRLTYSKKMYHEKYKKGRLSNKFCDCGSPALKGSIYKLCRECSDKRRLENKIAYQGKRKKDHLPTRIRENIKCRLRDALNGPKSKSIVKYLGCSIAQYLNHIESKWDDTMSWENYGFGPKTWQIDHNINLATDYSDLTLHYYTNHQPMWYEEHLEKTRRENRTKRQNG